MNLFRNSLPRTKNQGFTVIELFAVVVIICILGALVAFTASGVQAKNRNAERQADVDTIKGQLETYYAQTNMYPTAGNLADGTWRAAGLKHLKTAKLEDPGWAKTNTACTAHGQPVAAAKPIANCYSYQVTSSDGSPCDNVATPCAHYTLTASLEGGEKYVKSSLN
jgi:prepilin-type N-terminal cleavage/methylation domain-containing protein